ncbi:hypothetical protein SmJEL517_g00616 [Synchytrium microbalum]|uniref:Protein FAM72 n=1 Tax=Synchytrium microbalum TaxID=1806994 RepID=A0A507CIP3_9FUNG|nr:uncharacterized protein SmJEL517_g00616 [Synchytrium microbalum]TPX37543.1 hypothetical protein SmJEL517_g00616 [Synchytrium microbalum]
MSSSSMTSESNSQHDGGLTFRLAALVDSFIAGQSGGAPSSSLSSQYPMSPSSTSISSAGMAPSPRPTSTSSTSSTTSASSSSVTTTQAVTVLRDAILRQHQSLPSPPPSQQSSSSSFMSSSNLSAVSSSLSQVQQQDLRMVRTSSSPMSATIRTQYGLAAASPTLVHPPPSALSASAPDRNTQAQQQQLHPQFGAKPVCIISCKTCSSVVCHRGMRALLLGNKRVELFSTDSQPSGVGLVCWADYTTENCQCRIRDGACMSCGSVVGYHVTSPCETCLEACHNGFHSSGVTYSERLSESGNLIRWAVLSPPHDDETIDSQRRELPVR